MPEAEFNSIATQVNSGVGHKFRKEKKEMEIGEQSRAKNLPSSKF